MKKSLLFFLFIVIIQSVVAQDYDPARIEQIKNNLIAIEADVPGLTEDIDIALQQTQLSTFLMGISEVHKINIDVNPSLRSTEIINNFKKVPVLDVLVYLCKLYNLDIDMTGTILSISQFVEPPKEPVVREIPISYNPTTATLFADLQNDNLAEVMKGISEKSGKGIFFAQGMGNERISAYIKDLPLEIAMEKIAFSNNLIVTKTKDGSFEFEKMEAATANANGSGVSRPQRSRRANFFFEVLDPETHLLDIDLENVAIADVIYDIGNELKLNIFTASPLDQAGTTSVKAQRITFDQLLTKIFESGSQSSTYGAQNNPRGQNGQNGQDRQQVSSRGKQFTFKVEDGVYYFGTSEQLTLRTSEVIPLYYRSIELLSDPESTGRSAGRTSGFNRGFGNGGFNSPTGFNGQQGSAQNDFGRNQNGRRERSSESSGGTIEDLIPEDIKENLSVTTDPELNSFIVSGPSENVIRFKEFIKKIDKPVPVVMIEVMILDISRSATLEAGVEWGIGENPTSTTGVLFPHSQINLGANTVNRILGRIDGSSFFNIGKVVPNFYANIKAMETNGILKVRSSPRITTLNGHRAYFSNGQTSYYAVTNQSFFGTQNPATSEITNFLPTDAELSLDVKPFVSADGEITMDIKVIQSSFNGNRVAENAPPDVDSREFTSIVKARNNDIIVLGGLEERRTSNTGTGVPFLARIPIIKWLFSKRVREGSKSKLTVLIKPTVIY